MLNDDVQDEDEVDYSGCYGMQVSPSDLINYLGDAFALNAFAESNGRSSERFASCVWGHSGVGKSQIIRQFADRPVEWKGQMYDGYKVHTVPIAMFEEMGDLHGIPERYVCVVRRNDTSWIPETLMSEYVADGWRVNHRIGTRTKYAQPDWVPIETVPTIFHLEDWNRASLRIIKGIMQLLQTYGMISWQLPEGCHIVLTGNPDDQDYLVSSMDSAVLTRIRHITLREDAKEWSVWAQGAGLDPRGISFVLAYPEMMMPLGTERTNPRTLAEFFRFLKGIENPSSKENRRRVEMMAHSLLDETTVTTFLVFLERDAQMIVEPEDILAGHGWVDEHINTLMKTDDVGEKRVDVLGVIVNRLFSYIVQPDMVPTAEQVKNFQHFITLDSVEADMRHNVCMRIARVKQKGKMQQWILGSDVLKEMIRDIA